MDDTSGVARGASLPAPSSPASTSRKEWRAAFEHSSGSAGDEVQQEQEMHDAMSFNSIQVDGIEIGGLYDGSENKLRNLAKKRDALRQIETQLRADMIVRSAIVVMKDNLNYQIEEQAGLIADAQGQELHEAMNFPLIQIDEIGSLDDDSEKKLQSLTKKRDELQQMEIQLRAGMIARSAIVKMKNNFDSQINEPAALRAKLQEKFEEREQRIMKLHTIISDYEATKAKEDRLQEQNKEIPYFRREHDNIETERAIKQTHCIQEHIPKRDRQVSFPNAALEHLFSLISSTKDRNSISLVCKHWYSLERHSRRRVSIRNCDNVSPRDVIRRFTNVRSVKINGNISPPLPPCSLALPWISMMVTSYLKMEEIRMRNMVVTDEDLELIGNNLKNLRDLFFRSCFGFSTAGLSYIAANCRNLRKLHLLDLSIDDVGLGEIVAPCKELQDLDIQFVENNLTEQGILSVAMSCPKLHSIMYECSSMTNAVLLKIADQLPNLLELGISLTELNTDHLTNEPFDIGFGAILHRCKNLKLLYIRELVITERLLENVGTYGKKLETLKLFSVGNLDWGLHHIMAGCTSLRYLIIEKCEFGKEALLAIDCWPETLKSLHMWPSPVKYEVCKLLKERHPELVFKVNDEKMPLLDVVDGADESVVESLLIYRTVV